MDSDQQSESERVWEDLRIGIRNSTAKENKCFELVQIKQHVATEKRHAVFSLLH